MVATPLEIHSTLFLRQLWLSPSHSRKGHFFEEGSRMRVLCFSLFLGLALLGSSASADGDVTSGEASYYHDKFQGRKTASGEAYDKDALTAAHRTLPFGTRLRVTRIDTQQSVLVRVNDRGPAKSARVIDLSRKAAEELGLLTAGVANVDIVIVDSWEEQDPPLPTLVLLP